MESYYQFFGTNLIFRTNNKHIEEEFRKVYGFFRTDKFDREDIICSLTKNGHYRLQTTSARYNSEYTITGEISVDTYFSLFSPVIFAVKNHFLIHSGSLATPASRDCPANESLIIAAPCGFGKTTMTGELLQAGFTFLSDELAPLSLDSGLIQPFPRAMGIIKGQKKELREIPSEASEANKANKVRKIDSGIKPGYVIFLTLEQLEKDPENCRLRHLEIALGRVDKKIQEEFSLLPGVKKVSLITGRMYPLLRLVLEPEAYIVPEIQRICDQQQVPIMYSLKGQTLAPDFNAPPQLKEITPREGVLELSQHILNSQRSALLEETFAGSRTRLVFELAGLLGKARFYNLTIGKLTTMVKLVEELCKSKKK